jgi:hypothetical protein
MLLASDSENYFDLGRPTNLRRCFTGENLKMAPARPTSPAASASVFDGLRRPYVGQRPLAGDQIVELHSIKISTGDYRNFTFGI